MKKHFCDFKSFKSSLVCNFSNHNKPSTLFFKPLVVLLLQTYICFHLHFPIKSQYLQYFSIFKTIFPLQKNSSTSIFVSICSGFHLFKRFMSANLSPINFPYKREKTWNWWPFKCKKSFSSVEFLSEPRRTLRSLLQYSIYFYNRMNNGQMKGVCRKRRENYVLFCFPRIHKPWKINLLPFAFFGFCFHNR